MSTSLLYHGFGLVGVHHEATYYKEGKITFKAVMTRKLAVCPACKSLDVTKEGSKIRILKLCPLGLKPTRLHLKIYRLKCHKCGAIRWPKLPFAGKKKDSPIPLPGLF